MSSRHLSRLFNDQTGMSLADYTNRVRIALADELLKQTRLDMERVAERAGIRVAAPVPPRLGTLPSDAAEPYARNCMIQK